MANLPLHPSALLRLGSSSSSSIEVKSAILNFQHKHRHHLHQVGWCNGDRKIGRSWICVPAGKKAKVITGAKAMMGKYKGTQMREEQLTELIEKKVMEAKEVCGEKDITTDECKVAWDEVEEVSQAKADLRLKLEMQQDPLESFCQDNPETDECRVYED